MNCGEKTGTTPCKYCSSQCFHCYVRAILRCLFPLKRWSLCDAIGLEIYPTSQIWCVIGLHSGSIVYIVNDWVLSQNVRFCGCEPANKGAVLRMRHNNPQRFLPSHKQVLAFATAPFATFSLLAVPPTYADIPIRGREICAKKVLLPILPSARTSLLASFDSTENRSPILQPMSTSHLNLRVPRLESRQAQCSDPESASR